MRVRATAATAALLLAALTACGGNDNSSDKADNAAKPKAPAATHDKRADIDCHDPSVSQADWTKYCSNAGRGSSTESAGATDLAFGKTARTVGAQTPADGSQGGEMLEVTPTTVVYQQKAMGNTAANGVYAIITVKDRAPAGKAAESAPIEGGGWKWIAPDGQALDEGENDASSITPQGFTGGGSIPAGAWAWDTVAFDLSKAQANGGTLVYTDGGGQTWRWKVPAQETGPQLAALKKGMEGNY